MSKGRDLSASGFMEARGHIHLEVVEFRLDQTVEVYASLKAGQIKAVLCWYPTQIAITTRI